MALGDFTGLSDPTLGWNASASYPNLIGAAAPSASPTPDDWAKIQAALGKLGTQATGAAGAADDSKYLRIQAGAAPFSQGGAGLPNLLSTLIQMHQNAALAQQPQFGQRMSLLG